ncbi:MAG: glycosyltransferase [Planctomycetota bacterium]|nr:glycosyltransferase [Planctomycetota bacterium]
MIKVAMLIPTLDRSGAEKQLTLLAAGLPKDEFDVHVLALTRGGPYEATLRDAQVPVTVLNKRWKFDPLALRRLKRWLREHQPHILHTWLFAANAYGRLAVGKRSSTKVIVSERCVDSWKSGWQRWLDRHQIPRTHHLVGNSNSVVNFYAGLGFPRERMSAIPNGVLAPQPLTESEQQDRRREWRIPRDAKLIGFAGRLAKQKRVRDLVWTMQLLTSLNDAAYLVVMGDGPERDDLEAFSRHYGLDNRIRFVGPQPDADRLLGMFDVFWLASDFEGMSNSLMEAMAAGVPSIVSDIPPNRELITDGVEGRFFSVGDSTAACRITAEILADPDVMRRMGDAGARRAQADFSIESMIERYAELYRNVDSQVGLLDG